MIGLDTKIRILLGFQGQTRFLEHKRFPNSFFGPFFLGFLYLGLAYENPEVSEGLDFTCTTPSISDISRFAEAVIRSLCVIAVGICVAIVRICFAFVDI